MSRAHRGRGKSAGGGEKPGFEKLFSGGSSSASKMAAAASSPSHVASSPDKEKEAEAREEAHFCRIQKMIKAELAQAVSDFKSQINDLGQRVADMEEKQEAVVGALEEDKQAIEDHEMRLQNIQLKMEDYENRSRRSNIRLRGLPESYTDLKSTTYDLLKVLLPQTEDELFRVDRVHRAYTKIRDDGRPRDVVAKMHYYETRDAVLQAARPLRSLPGLPPEVKMYADLSPATLDRRRLMRPVTQVLQNQQIRYRWGFPFALIFQLNDKHFAPSSLQEARKILLAEKLECPLLEQEQTKRLRPNRGWQTVKSRRIEDEVNK